MHNQKLHYHVKTLARHGVKPPPPCGARKMKHPISICLCATQHKTVLDIPSKVTYNSSTASSSVPEHGMANHMGACPSCIAALSKSPCLLNLCTSFAADGRAYLSPLPLSCIQTHTLGQHTAQPLTPANGQQTSNSHTRFHQQSSCQFTDPCSNCLLCAIHISS
jgi:hypothetical protein